MKKRPPIIRNWEKLERLSPVGDRRDLVPQSGFGQVPQQRDRPDDPAQLAQRLVQPVAPGVVAQTAQQRHRGQPALPDREARAQQVGPVLLDQPSVDHVVAEQRVDVLVRRGGRGPVKAQVVPVPDPGQKVESEQCRETENRQALAPGIAM